MKSNNKFVGHNLSLAGQAAEEPVTQENPLGWNIRVMMAKKKIFSVTELHRRLLQAGVDISSAQLTRIVSELPERMNMKLFAALLEVLDCEPNDLLIRPQQVSKPREGLGTTANLKPARAITQPRPRVTPLPETDAEDVTGPKVTPFPIVNRNK
ncbi:MAG: helix-turn-helix transcriptional regulator [Blastocatellia bacterium]